MKESYVHIHILLDRTGSMEKIREDTIGGFNAFLREQKDLPGKATLSLIQFDSQDPYEVIHDFKPIIDVPELTRKTFVPRAMTPLLDAIGRTINNIDSRVKALAEEKRPEKVVAVIITDGQENASHEFRKDQIEKMVKEKQDKDKWQFVFLSADLASIDDALVWGFNAQAAMAYDPNQAGIKNVYASMSKSVAGYRADSDVISFSEEDRRKQQAENKRSK